MAFHHRKTEEKEKESWRRFLKPVWGMRPAHPSSLCKCPFQEIVGYVVIKWKLQVDFSELEKKGNEQSQLESYHWLFLKRKSIGLPIYLQTELKTVELCVSIVIFLYQQGIVLLHEIWMFNRFDFPSSWVILHCEDSFLILIAVLFSVPFPDAQKWAQCFHLSFLALIRGDSLNNTCM